MIILNLLDSVFNMVSSSTTTGYSTITMNNLNPIAFTTIIIAMIIGGCGKKLSEDMIRNHKLIDELKITDNVKIIEGPLNTTDLAYYYNCADVVADQFKLGEGGVIYLEAMACKKPVLINLDQIEQKKVFEEPPPIINAKNSDEINDCLEKW